MTPIKIVILSTLLILSTAQNSKNTQEIPTSPDIVDDLIKKLFRMCGETQTISLWECERSMVKNDKKIGNFRNGFNYTRETIYMMATFDKNNDARLNYRELYYMGGQIMEGNAAEHIIAKKIKQLEESGWAKENMDKYFKPYTLQEIDEEIQREKQAKKQQKSQSRSSQQENQSQKQSIDQMEL